MEKRKVSHKHVASLEALPPKWATISGDGGKWIHPHTGEHVEFLLLIDEGSRFRMGKVMCKGRKQTMNAMMFTNYLREGWCQYFGFPQNLRLDPAGAFRSNEVERFCDKHGIYLDFIPGEAHWKLGVCEQAIQGVKTLMDKLAEGDPRISPEEALSTAIHTFNNRELVRGFSPSQHAFGRAPDETGRFVQSLTGQPTEQFLPHPGTDFETTVERMKQAEQAHSEWNAAERIRRALQSRGNRPQNYQPGDLVFYWRKQVSGKYHTSQQQKTGCFLGPARILATETHRDPDGNLRPSSSIWVIRGRRLIKCCPEQLRPATQREELLEHLHEDTENKAPWTFTRLTEGLGGNEFEDVTSQVPTLEEWHQGQSDPQPSTSSSSRPQHSSGSQMPVEMDPPDAPMAPPATPRMRVWGKRSEQPTPSTTPPLTRQRVGAPEAGAELVTQEAWYNMTTETSRQEACGKDQWQDSTSIVEVAIDLPETNRSRRSFVNDLEGYFVGALKRRAVEVSMKNLTSAEREGFEQAKAVEVKNFIAAKAFEALPPELRPPEEKAIKMRWLLTWKVKEDGSTKPKARAILLGYQDPEYEHRSTTSPVMTKQTRQLMLAATALFGWKVWKGDVTGAFLQGRTYPGELYCIPCDEICSAMGLDKGSITRVRKGCYGLVDAPIEWYRSVSEYLETLGLVWSGKKLERSMLVDVETSRKTARPDSRTCGRFPFYRATSLPSLEQNSGIHQEQVQMDRLGDQVLYPVWSFGGGTAGWVFSPIPETVCGEDSRDFPECHTEKAEQ